MIETINPATGKTIHQYTEMTDAEVAGIIDATHLAFLKWRTQDIKQRAAHMQQLAKVLRNNKNNYAELMANEMGKPLAQGLAEIEKCAIACEHYAENSENYLKPREVKTEMAKSVVLFQPLGIVFAIMPWNFPFWQVIRFAAPSLMAGNAGLLKHAPISTGTALAIEHAFLAAGFPENLFRALIISEEQAGIVIENAKVKAVTLTGSTGAGKIVAAKAGSALKKSVLELGGSDPYLILADADLENAAEECIKSRMNNAGQSCIAAKRLIAVEAIADEFTSLIQEKLQKYKMGNPLDANTNCGPLARRDLRDKLHAQVEQSVKLGAKLLLGGSIPDMDGFYYPPTLLTNVSAGMPAYDEELFGPVMSILHAKNTDEAIQIANSTSYGLGAAIFTEDLALAEVIASEKIAAGTCAINTMVASDPRLPFGGINQSGYGRELSLEGIHEFVNVKTINICSPDERSSFFRG